MRKPKTDEQTPSTKDLHKVIDSFNTYYEPPRRVELKKAVTEAEKAVEHFQRTNAEFRRLQTILSKARRSLNGHVEGSKREFQKARQACRNAIYLRGAIPSTIKMIEAFIKKYPHAMK